MKAAVLNQQNKSLDIREVPIPKVKAGQVLIKLKAISLNHLDLWNIKELPESSESEIILGSDGVGEIIELADGVDKKLLGQNVIINPSMKWGTDARILAPEYEILGHPTNGTFAEFISIDHQYIYKIPGHLSLQEAAAIPMAGLTSFRALYSKAEASKYDTVLITGVGGGVALFALQLAVHNGNKVYVTSGSSSKIQQAVSLGAVAGVNYKESTWINDLLKKEKGFDVIIDSSGGDSFKDLVELANPGGRIVLLGRTAGKNVSFNARTLFSKQISIHGTMMGTPNEFQAMLDFIDYHKIKPVIDSQFSLDNIMDGINKMNDSQQMGKIIINI